MSAVWNMIGRPIATADNDSTIPTIYQRFRLPAAGPTFMVQGVGLGVILHAAAFTDLSVEIWNDVAGVPTTKIATSLTAWTKAAIDAQFPLDYKFLYAGFQFSPLLLRAGVYYNLAVRLTGYTGDATSHVAWRQSYPDCQYPSALGFTVQAIDAAVMPLECNFFGSEG